MGLLDEADMVSLGIDGESDRVGDAKLMIEDYRVRPNHPYLVLCAE